MNTPFMMGGALGLAILVSIATSRTGNLLSSGEEQLVALNSGYHAAFLVGALFALAASTIAGALLRHLPKGAQAHEAPEAMGAPVTPDAD